MKAFGEMPKDAHARFPLSYMPKIIGFMLKGMLTKNTGHLLSLKKMNLW
jgi:hypothetical protein